MRFGSLDVDEVVPFKLRKELSLEQLFQDYGTLFEVDTKEMGHAVLYSCLVFIVV
jgi:hypothetical protein